MFRRITFAVIGIVALAAASCESVPLLAPTNSTLTINAQSRVVATGGTTEVTATVLESGGTPVHNGTVVRFTTTLGRMDPIEAQTRNGIAVTTFIAGNDSGIAEVRATSGGAGGSSTTTPADPNTPGAPTTNSSSNVVLISVGSGAVDTITLRANPATVSANGGTVTLIATVVAVGGRALPAIPVSFNANRGTLSSSSALTDANGEARVTLTTNVDTSVTATAGTKTSTAATITAQPGPSVALTCAIGATPGCATATVGQTIVFTAQRGQGTSNLVSATLDFGDNSSINLGTLSAPTTVPHTYSQTGTYTARLTGTDANGESSTSIQVIQVNAPTAIVNASITTAPRTVTATATVSGTVTQYQWNWDDATPVTNTTSPSAVHTYGAAGEYDIVMTATLQGGTTVSATVTIVVP
jgi:adhesin/invasin